MGRFLAVCGILAVFAVFYGPGQAQAQSGPAPFECPWTPVSGTNPSADGCYGGGNDGCGGDDGEPDVPCEDQTPKKTTSPDPTWDVVGVITRARDELVAMGEDISGDNCGKIVERACYQGYLPPTVGMLFKDYGTQYNNHSIDFLVDENGQGWDVVISCGGDGTDPTNGGTPGVGAKGCCGDYVTGGASDCQPIADGPFAGRYIDCP